MPNATDRLPDDLAAMVRAAVDAGLVESETELVAEAVRSRFEDDPDLRVGAVAKLYEETRMTVEAAADLADVDRTEMERLLREHGVEPHVGARPDDFAAGVAAADEALDGGDE